MVAMSYLIIGFVFIVISRVSAGDEDAMRSCLELFDPEGVELMCCESLESFKNMSEHSDECLKENSDGEMCEYFQCILNQRGMMKDDQIDEAGATKFYDQLEEDYPGEKPLIERVRRECMGGKYATYPPEDGCPAVQFYVCSYIHTFLECDSWKTHDICSKMADDVKKCKAALGE